MPGNLADLATSIGMTVIIDVPDFSDISTKIYKKIGRQIEKELDKMENALKPAYKTWSSKSKPEWKKSFGDPRRIVNAGGSFNVEGFSFVHDEFAGTLSTTSTPFVFVEGGTVGGRARFSSDYRPMTRPRIVNSRARRGSVVGGVGPQIRGITARDFTEVIAERRAPFITKSIEKTVNDGLLKILTKGKRITVVGSTR